jgi:TolB protein
LLRDRAYRVDADGANLSAVTAAGTRVFSPAWDPSGRRLVYTEFGSGQDRLYVLNLATGERRLVPPTSTAQNWTPVFSPDGATLAFARTSEDGTDVFTYNLASECCLQRLTVGRFSDNLSPTFSPDGRRIAFVSDRPGSPQIYVMAADGTGQELFAPFDFGVTGSSNAPDWSPDGLNIAFHRVVSGTPQVFVMDVASRQARQLSSTGRNEDPAWAPDGRHLIFVSDRTGSRQLWVIDLDTGRVRQLTRVGEARLPAWSPRMGQP